MKDLKQLWTEKKCIACEESLTEQNDGVCVGQYSAGCSDKPNFEYEPPIPKLYHHRCEKKAIWIINADDKARLKRMDEDKQPCDFCKGIGKILVQTGSVLHAQTYDCGVCHGTGKVISKSEDGDVNGN